MFLRFFYEFLTDQIILTKEQITIGFWCAFWIFPLKYLNQNIFGIKARTYLQLPLRQWGASNVYLLVLFSWKVNIAKNPIAGQPHDHIGWATSIPLLQSILLTQGPIHKRSIFQTLWKQDCCARFLFIELETSNFGYLLIF